MRNHCFLLIHFQVAYALSEVNVDNFEMSYYINYENSCHTEKDRFQFILGSSINHCVKECSARQHCEALNFRRGVNVCELFSTSEPGQLNSGHCLYVKKDNINVIQIPCLTDCKYDEVCETFDSGTGRCISKECVNGPVLDHTEILGNQREVGKKIRYQFDKEKNVTCAIVAECLDTGGWSANDECHKTPTIGNECTSDTDCKETEGVCIEGVCFCNRLYRYNTTIKNCTKVCQSMSNEFTTINGKHINGFDSDVPTIRSNSIEECESACIDNPDCLSFESWPSGNDFGCSTGSVTFEMIEDAVPEELYDSPGIDLHTRKCI